MRFHLLFCCVLVSSGHTLAAAAGRVGEAEVRAGDNGEQCFTVAAHEESRNGAPEFDAVTVSDPQAKKVLWRMALPRERSFPVMSSMCIPYAGRVNALPQTPAAKLLSGRVYHVRIDARLAKGGRSPGSYEARFCLAPQLDGNVAVHHIAADGRDGRHPQSCPS